MALFGARGLIWTVAMDQRIPVTLIEVRALPVRVLWQCETMLLALERIARREQLETAAARAHAAAVKRAAGKRR